MLEDENSSSKKNNHFKKKNNNFKNNKTSKIDKIKKYYEDMNKDPEKVKAYVKKKTIEILSLSDKSRFEIEEKIYKNIIRKTHEDLVSCTLDFFEEQNYINDKRFVENYIRIKYNSGYGRKYIEQELKQKKVDMNLFEDNIEDYNFIESLQEYKDRKYENIEELTYKELNKLHQKMVLRGFSFGDVKEVFSDILVLTEDIVEKEQKVGDKTKFLEKMTRKGYGKNKIKQESRNKNITLTDDDFNEIDFYEIALEYKNKKFGEDKITDPKLKQKFINHMLGRGFIYDEIKEAS